MKIQTEEKVSVVRMPVYSSTSMVLYSLLDSSNPANGRTSHSWQLGGAIGNTLSREIGVCHKWCASRANVSSA